MKKTLIFLPLILLIACEGDNPTSSISNKIQVTAENLSGMWYLSQDGFKGEMKIDGVVTGTYDEQDYMNIDSTEVYLFGATTLRRYYPRYWNDCYSEDVQSYAINNNEIVCEWFEDDYDTVDSNGHFEHWIFQETYILNNDWYIIWREVGNNDDGEYDGLYTAIYKRYSKNLPNPVWPWEKCTSTLSKKTVKNLVRPVIRRKAK